MLAAIFFVFVFTYMPGFFVKTVNEAVLILNRNLQNLRKWGPLLQRIQGKEEQNITILRSTGATPTPPFTQLLTCSTGPLCGSTQSSTSALKRNTRSHSYLIFLLSSSIIVVNQRTSLQDALKHLLPCKSERQTSQRTTRMKSFNMESTDTSNSDSRRNTGVIENSDPVETRDNGSPSLVDK